MQHQIDDPQVRQKGHIHRWLATLKSELLSERPGPAGFYEAVGCVDHKALHLVVLTLPLGH